MQKRASLKYAKENLKSAPLDLNKEEYRILSEVAKSEGKSVNGYIKEAIKEKLSFKVLEE